MRIRVRGPRAEPRRPFRPRHATPALAQVFYWQLRYDRVVALGLNSRIVDEPASNSACPGSSEENLHADAWAPSK